MQELIPAEFLKLNSPRERTLPDIKLPHYFDVSSTMAFFETVYHEQFHFK